MTMPSLILPTVAFVFSSWILRAIGQQAPFPPRFCTTWPHFNCVGGDNALITTEVRVWYEYTESGLTRNETGPTLFDNNETQRTVNLSYPFQSFQNGTEKKSAEYTFEQLEHGGGLCNCVYIFIDCAENNRVTLCSGSASIPRRVKASWSSDRANISTSTIPQIAKKSPIVRHIGAGGNLTSPSFDVSFQIYLNFSGACDNPIDAFEESVEFSVRRLSEPEEWIPLAIINRGKNDKETDGHKNLSLGNPKKKFSLRGYPVDVILLSGIGQDTLHFTIGGIEINDLIQYRWLQTSKIGRSPFSDVWLLDNIEIVQMFPDQNSLPELCETFSEDILDPLKWPNDHVRNGQLIEYCKVRETLVLASTNSDPSLKFAIHSRGLLTNMFQVLERIPLRETILHNCGFLSNSSVVQPSATTVSKTAIASSTLITSTSVLTSMTTENIQGESLSLMSTLLPTPSSVSTVQQSGSSEIHINNMIESNISASFSISSTPTHDGFSSTVLGSQPSLFVTAPTQMSLTTVDTPSSYSISPTLRNDYISSTSLINIIKTSLIEPQSIFHTPTKPSPSVEIADESSQMECPLTSTVIVEVPIEGPKSLTDQEYIAANEKLIMNQVLENSNYSRVISLENRTLESIALLRNISDTLEDDPLLLSYLLRIVANAYGFSSLSNIKELLEVGWDILQAERQTLCQPALTRGMTVLLAIEDFMFIFSGSASDHIITVGGISIVSVLHDLSEAKDPVITLDSTYTDVTPAIKIEISLQLLQNLCKDMESVGTSSVLYSRVADLFEKCLDKNETLGSDIVGISLWCGNESCSNRNTFLPTNISVSFEHSTEVMNTLRRSKAEVTCALLSTKDNESSTLSIGHWSTIGCTKNTRLSSSSRTVCDCNQLAHFALLLTPSSSQESCKAFSLRVIAYICVAACVTALSLTVLTLLVHESLHKMINYTHIHLCINLAIALIILVAGIDKTGDLDEDVPIHCQAIAVFLHYFFLVSFMWMLMECVHLLMNLFRFVVIEKLSCTITLIIVCYGVPLLYLLILTIPLGFGLRNEDHYYGSHIVCYFNSRTSYVWSFIAPVLLIFFAAMVLLIISAGKMWDNQSTNSDQPKSKWQWSWMPVAILVLTMLLAWIFLVLMLKFVCVVVLQFIFFILVAILGLLIFIVVVIIPIFLSTACGKYQSNKTYFEEKIIELNSIGDGGKNDLKVEIDLDSPMVTASNNLEVMGMQLEAFGSHNDISIF